MPSATVQDQTKQLAVFLTFFFAGHHLSRTQNTQYKKGRIYIWYSVNLIGTVFVVSEKVTMERAKLDQYASRMERGGGAGLETWR
jgi:hypothetical protein